MKRRFFAFILTLALLLSLLPITAAATPAYGDVAGHWAEAAINKWSSLGILAGYDGKFCPSDPITRADMAVVLDRIMRYKTAEQNTFADLGEAYYTDAMLKANKAGVVLGDGKLARPMSYITREEAAVMLGRALGLQESAAGSGFSDKADISPWALGYVNAMASRGFMNGYQGAFNPKGKMARAEVVTVLNNAIAGLYSKAGEYSGNVSGVAVVSVPGVVLKDMTVSGDLILSEGVGNGEVTLNNIKVTGNVIVRGGGANSIHIEGGSEIGGLIIEKTDGGQLRIVTADGTAVDVVLIDDIKDDIILTGAFSYVSIAAGVSVQAVGARIDDAVIAGKGALLEVDEDSKIETLDVSKTAEGAGLQVRGSIGALTIDAVIDIECSGTIEKAVVNVSGIVFTGNEPLEVTGDVGVLGEKDTDTGGIVPGGGGGGGGGSGGTPTPLDQVKAGTTITGSVSGGIVAQFPASIPVEIIAAGYKINSEITLGAPLPAGSRVSVMLNGSPYIINKDIGSVTSFTITELFPGAAPAPFDSGYNNKTETYMITITGNMEVIDTTLTLKALISNDNFSTAVVLEEKEFDLDVDAVDTAMPAFLEGYPKAGEIGPSSFKILARVYETCLIDYVVYLHDPDRIKPTVDEIKSGNGLGSCVRTGHTLFVTDLENLLTIADLTEGLSYDVFLVAGDLRGNTSEVLFLTVTTAEDTTPPAFHFGYPKLVKTGDSGFDILVKSDEAATYYVVAYEHDAARPDPEADDIAAGQDGAGESGNLISCSTGMIGSKTEGSISLTGLRDGAVYDVFVVAMDQKGSFSGVQVRSMTTCAIPAPTWTEENGRLIVNMSGLDSACSTGGLFILVIEFFDSQGKLPIYLVGVGTQTSIEVYTLMDILPADTAFVKARIYQYNSINGWDIEKLTPISDDSQPLNVTITAPSDPVTSIAYDSAGRIFTLSRASAFASDHRYALAYAKPDTDISGHTQFMETAGSMVKFIRASDEPTASFTFLEFFPGTVNDDGEAFITVSRQTGIRLT